MSISKILTAGVAALTLGGAVLASTGPADARPGVRGGGFAGARAGAFRGGFAGPRFGAYRGGFAGRRFGYGRGYRYGGYGLGAGLALGALAATTYPSWGYGYAGYPYGADCWWQPRQFVDRYGRAFVKNVQVCY